jgi:iron transport multicopper oxidase
MKVFPVVVVLTLLTTARAAIGPIADVHIVNKNIAPDGFTRSYVDISSYLLIHSLRFLDSAVLAGGTAGSAAFPGPLIIGFKVMEKYILFCQPY